MIRETIVPSIPDIRDDNIKDVLRAIKATIDVREGFVGDPLDQVVTMRELAALNVASTAGTTVTQSGSTLPLTTLLPPLVDGYSPSSDYTTPPQPSGLRARGGFTNVYLEWDGAPYRNHGFTEIWRSQTDNLGSAYMVGTTAASVYADPAETDRTYFYWIRFVSVAGTVGAYNATSGTQANTAIDVSAAMSALSADLQSSQLFIDLGTRIAYAETGITSLQKITATSAQQVTTLSSTVGKNTSAIQIQSTVSDGLKAQYTVKIDNNGHVSGFGLASQPVNGTISSAFIVRADRFAIAGVNDTSNPLGTVTPTKVPFMVNTVPTVVGGKTYPAGTWIDTAFIANATIGTALISDLTADKITTGNLTAAIGVSTGKIYGGVNTAFGFGTTNFGTGFFLGLDSSVYKFRVGSPTQNVTWDGSNLTVTGNITATGGSFGAALITGQLTAGQIDTRGLTIKDASGNIILSSGSAITGGNMIPNADLRDGTSGEQPTVATPLFNVATGFLQFGGTAVTGLNRSSWTISGVGVGYQRITSGTPNIADIAIFADGASLAYNTASKYFQISPAKRYEASVYVAANSSVSMDVGIVFVDASGTPLSYEPHGTAQTNANGSGVNSLDQMVRLSVFSAVGSIPSNARGAYMIIRTYGATNGTYTYFARPYFGEAGASQVDSSPWSLGRGIGQITASNASTYIANASLGTAQIQNASVDTLRIAGEAVTVPRYGEHYVAGLNLTTSYSGDLATATYSISGLASGETARIIAIGVIQAYPSNGTATNFITGIFLDGTLVNEIGNTYSSEGITITAVASGLVGNGTYSISLRACCRVDPNGSATKDSNALVSRIILIAAKR